MVSVVSTNRHITCIPYKRPYIQVLATEALKVKAPCRKYQLPRRTAGSRRRRQIGQLELRRLTNFPCVSLPTCFFTFCGFRGDAR